jgi:hypothetical protein
MADPIIASDDTVNPLGQSIYKTLSINIRFRDCDRGEQLKSSEYFD